MFCVAGPFVPVTDLRPVVTAAGNVPVMDVSEKRLEKLTTVPPVAAEMNLRKYAFCTLPPMPAVNVAVTELPFLKSPVVTSVAS